MPENKVEHNADLRGDFIKFAQLLIERVNSKLENGEDPTTSELSAVSRFANLFLKEELKRGDEPVPKNTLTVEDAVVAVEKYLKGDS